VQARDRNREFLIHLRNERAMELQKLRQLNTATGYDALSIRQKLDGAVREANQTMSPVWIAALRKLTPAQKLARSNQMFLDARDALIRQGLRQGLSHEEALREAAHRLLLSNAW
jgi:hypothetical protein